MVRAPRNRPSPCRTVYFGDSSLSHGFFSCPQHTVQERTRIRRYTPLVATTPAPAAATSCFLAARSSTQATDVRFCAEAAVEKGVVFVRLVMSVPFTHAFCVWPRMLQGLRSGALLAPGHSRCPVLAPGRGTCVQMWRAQCAGHTSDARSVADRRRVGRASQSRLHACITSLGRIIRRRRMTRCVSRSKYYISLQYPAGHGLFSDVTLRHAFLSAQMTDQWYETKRGPKGPKQGITKRFAAGLGALHHGVTTASASKAFSLDHPHILPGDAERLREVLWTGPVGIFIKVFLGVIATMSAALLCAELSGMRHRKRKGSAKRGVAARAQGGWAAAPPRGLSGAALQRRGAASAPASADAAREDSYML